MELDDKKRRVDLWLKAATKEYSTVEPRAGLEQEILRGLRTVPERSRLRTGWLVFAAAMIALFVAGVLISKRHEKTQKIAIEKIVEPAIDAKNIADVPKTSIHPPVTPSSIRRKRPLHPITEAPATEAKAQSWPAQFPTPHPLTEQEKLLAQYVRERPQEARLVARARAEMAQQDMLMFEHPEQQAPNSKP